MYVMLLKGDYFPMHVCVIAFARRFRGDMRVAHHHKEESGQDAVRLRTHKLLG